MPPSCPYKLRGPRRNSYNMVWCFVISCAYSHIAEDTPREVLKSKFEFKVILCICVVFLFPRPPSCHIMPLQNDRFPSKGMFVLNTAFVGRQLDFLSLPPCKKRIWENTMARHAWPSYFPMLVFFWIFKIVSENLKFSDFFWFFQIFSENLKFSDFFWKSEIFRFFLKIRNFQFFSAFFSFFSEKNNLNWNYI